MTALTPELLMRYADGEVSLPERQLIEERLPTDPEARDLLASFQHQKTLLPATFSCKDSPSGLDRFERAMDLAFEQRRLDRRRTELRRWTLPLAASALITLAGGLLATFYAEQRIQSETARILAERAAEDAQTRELALQTRIEALERIVSGDSLSWSSDATGAMGTITPLRTYQGPDGQWCREFEEITNSGTAAQQTFSIACRTPAGLWRGHGMNADPRQL
jgi:surface antigen